LTDDLGRTIGLYLVRPARIVEGRQGAFPFNENLLGLHPPLAASRLGGAKIATIAVVDKAPHLEQVAGRGIVGFKVQPLTNQESTKGSCKWNVKLKFMADLFKYTDKSLRINETRFENESSSAWLEGVFIIYATICLMPFGGILATCLSIEFNKD